MASPAESADSWHTMAALTAYHPGKLASHLRISLRQLERRFMDAFGQSPREWLGEARMQAALRLLECASSVKETAYALGYKHPTHFSADFKRRFDLSPSALLKARAASDYQI